MFCIILYNMQGLSSDEHKVLLKMSNTMFINRVSEFNSNFLCIENTIWHTYNAMFFKISFNCQSFESIILMLYWGQVYSYFSSLTYLLITWTLMLHLSWSMQKVKFLPLHLLVVEQKNVPLSSTLVETWLTSSEQ